ncbi:MAG: vWA domain-containing protein, partial [Phycisphaerales bacterium]|nr:vWA domain-containing protein [Phycisphaerales bacterium]
MFNRSFCNLVLASHMIGAMPWIPSSSGNVHDPRPDPPGHLHGERPRVQIAILLDTSNSMDGLIFQARTQLWTIVNEFARCRRDGVRPRLEVALYEYGNNSLSPGEGYVRQVIGFTDDLDHFSEKLWQLTTNGGHEFCGEVIWQAVRGLSWSRDPRAYRAIFIAGNEPFTQGELDYREACAAAVERGIVVNT